MTTLFSLQQQCILKIESALKGWNKNNNTSIPMPTIEWNNRLTSTSGRATTFLTNPSKCKIELSTKLLRLNGIEFINRTPTHELAHIIAGLTFGRHQGHNANWTRINYELGGDGTRCHSMKTTRSAVSKTKIDQLLKKHGLPTNIIGTKVDTTLGLARVIEIAPSRRKYPIIIELNEGGKIKLTPSQYKYMEITQNEIK